LETKTEASKRLSVSACKIKVSKNGPYLISGRIPLAQQIIGVDKEGTPSEWHAGKTFQSGERCALCRCGQSKNIPFCDGTHLKANFDGTETTSRKSYAEQAKVIEGPSIRLKDAEELCASARFCHRAGGIWNLVPNSNDSEAKKTAIEEACDCPSGRLVIHDKEEGKVWEPSFEPSIGLIEDPQMGVSGPIWVRGGIPIEAADGRTYETRNRVTLCRCGKSSNKPFCDSSHYPEEHEHEGNVQ
jgi:CDGSH-type Zn-finger protein